MAVLQRFGKPKNAPVGIVVFVTRNLKDEELGRLYDDVDELVRKSNLRTIVIPCDELGVCPEYRYLTKGIHGLPGRFVGIRSFLRRKLGDAYGCKTERDPTTKTLGFAFEQLQITEQALITAERMIQAVDAAFPNADEQLDSVRCVFNEARLAYASALATYYDVWTTSRRLT